MAKLKLVAAPTFRAVARIPLAGGESTEVGFTFKHRTRKAFEQFRAETVAKSETLGTDADAFMQFVEGWDLEDEFNRDNVDLFLDNYGGAFSAVFVAYTTELHNWKVKN